MGSLPLDELRLLTSASGGEEQKGKGRLSVRDVGKIVRAQRQRWSAYLCGAVQEATRNVQNGPPRHPEAALLSGRLPIIGTVVPARTGRRGNSKGRRQQQ